jgi:hypothetical protein
MSDRRIERPAVDYAAVRMLETDPKKYFELRREHQGFGFTPSEPLKTGTVVTKDDD